MARDDQINQAIQARIQSEQGKDVDYHELRERVRRGDLGDLDRDATWQAISDAAEGFDYDISEQQSAARGTEAMDKEDSARLSGLLGEFEKKFGTPDHWKWGPVGTPGYDYDESMPGDRGEPGQPGSIESVLPPGSVVHGYGGEGTYVRFPAGTTPDEMQSAVSRAEQITSSENPSGLPVMGYPEDDADFVITSEGGESVGSDPRYKRFYDPGTEDSFLHSRNVDFSSLKKDIDEYKAAESSDYGSMNYGMDKSMEYRGMGREPKYGRRAGRGRMY